MNIKNSNSCAKERKAKLWQMAAIFIIAACMLTGCSSIFMKIPLEPKLFPVETPKVINEPIRLIIDDDSKTYVWKGSFWTSPYEIPFGKALEDTSAQAFGRDFLNIKSGGDASDTNTADADVEKTVVLKILNASLAPGIATFSKSKASLDLEATVLNKKGERICHVISEGKGIVSPGVKGAIAPLAGGAKINAVRGSCENAVVDALKKIVDQTVQCWSNGSSHN